MSDKNLTIKLKSLTCFITDEDKFDDVFLKHNKKRVWPIDKKHHPVPVGNTKLNFNISDLPANEALTIELWDFDKFSANDLLGTFTLIPDKPGGPYTVDMKTPKEKDVAKYTMEWQILWPEDD